MSQSLNQSRRPSISIYEYPEDLNPFKDEESEQVELRKPYIPLKTETSGAKEHKHKFWTFGKSRKKRSGSFSIKSTWNGIFGKRKESDGIERKPTITTVSSTYRNTSCNPETAASRLSTDQQEFDQALWTLSRRRKYTLDNSSRYSSSLTVNGDPKRIYDGCPQNTTSSILGDLTPKPPARRFGQANPKSTDEIPPLNYHEDCQTKDNEDDGCRTPVPPKRSGVRSSQRSQTPLDNEEHNSSIKSETMIDENENMPEDYVFKRFNRNPMQKSNLSINSCLSMASVYHSGRKKRRAPPPPPPTDCNASEPLHDNKETNNHTDADAIDNHQVVESIDILKEAGDIDEMTKRNQSMEDDSISPTINSSPVSFTERENEKDNSSSTTSHLNESGDIDTEVITTNNTIAQDVVQDNKNESSDVNDHDDTPMKIELKKEIGECVEIVKDVDIIENIDDSVVLRRKELSGILSSSESFCVKEEIEKIERQIKLLETTKLTKTRSRTHSLSYNNNENDYINDNVSLQRSASRRSLQENRRNFFKELTTNNKNDRVKIQIKEFPRQQNDIKIVRLSESPTSHTSTLSVASEKPVKVIELHISEPIKHKPEFTVTETDINPIPKPRRHNTHQTDDNNQLNTNDSHLNKDEEDEKSASSL